ncbi:hypothetical protein [Streptomyces hesseae]|uniref:Lipoprotein n=1 Tax=Streptomyces hesseae TaxID=3075519 RepID=A0ABU2ST23_9ACTN|nr:hypothetical protein [Streptomyces sp. DSM 40473]MDT0452141.1 hypothetical protein [Streptomyces sp. DSM 40473]
MQPLRSAVASAVVMTACAIALAPTTAQADEGPTGKGDMSFSVIDAKSAIPRTGTFQLRDLARFGIEQKAVERLAAGRPSAAEESAGKPALAAPDPAYNIVGEWKDKDGWDTTMRQGKWPGGDYGFGLTKVDQKHNLSLAAVKATTKYPRPTGGKKQQGGTSYIYVTDVLHVKCSGWWIFRTCRVVDVKAVDAVVNFRQLRDGKPFGVVTAYCENTPGRCPDWVRQSINI